MRTQHDRDAVTLAIAGAILVFGAVLVVGLVGAVVAQWLAGPGGARGQSGI